MVGARSIFRYHWGDSAKRLVLDRDWRFDYIGSSSQTYGWDVVLDGQYAWFMDNGKHSYLHKMIGAGVSPTPNQLIRVSMKDAEDHQILPISGLSGGSITNPPLYDPQRHIVIAYDSANRHLRAWRFDHDSRSMAPLWGNTPFGCASHMIHYPDTGELAINDYRRRGEEVVVPNIRTGAEIARVRTGGFYQGVVFPGAGWGRDFYWSTLGGWHASLCNEESVHPHEDHYGEPERLYVLRNDRLRSHGNGSPSNRFCSARKRKAASRAPSSASATCCHLAPIGHGGQALGGIDSGEPCQPRAFLVAPGRALNGTHQPQRSRVAAVPRG